MSRVGRSGASEPRGTGEQLERQRRGRKAVIIGGLIVVGFTIGFVTGFSQADNLFVAGSWPQALSMGLAVAYLATVIGGGIALSRHSDEFELNAQYKAAAAAGAAYMLIYPPWFLLWMGDVAVEPMHGVLFLAFWLVLALASIFYRFR
jgi:MFS family permease